MAKKTSSSESAGQALVIVESPAKARTIGKYLGKNFRVEASIGHVRDLPQGAKQVPAEYKKEPWANLGVNVQDGFTPIYVIPPGKMSRGGCIGFNGFAAELSKLASRISFVPLGSSSSSR